MRIRRFIIVLACLAAFAAMEARAQALPFETVIEGPAVGAYGGIVRGTLDASFNVGHGGLSDAGDCGQYENGSLSGFVAGVSVEFPFGANFGLVAGSEFSHRDASLEYPCVDPAGTRMPDGSIAEARTEFRADAGYDVVGVNIGASLRPFTLPFVATVSSSLSLCTGARYSARESIVTPVEASFVDGGQERSIANGEFTSGDIAVGFGVSIGYEARIGRQWSLVPRVGAFMGLTDEVASGAFRSRGLDATLGLTYRFITIFGSSTPIEAGAPAAR